MLQIISNERDIVIKEFLLEEPFHQKRRISLPYGAKLQSVVAYDGQIHVCAECSPYSIELADENNEDYELTIVRTGAVCHDVGRREPTFLGTVWFEPHRCCYHIYYKPLKEDE